MFIKNKNVIEKFLNGKIDDASMIIQFFLFWGLEKEKNYFLTTQKCLRESKLKEWENRVKKFELHSIHEAHLYNLNFTSTQMHRIQKNPRIEFWEEIPFYFNFKNVKAEINESLLNLFLYKNSYKLIHYVPLPLEMLKLQCQNRRYITLLLTENEWNNFNFDGKDVWQFLLHDLSHFLRFIENSECQIGQVGFSKFIKNVIENGLLENLTKRNPKFQEEFEYIYSDMNAYAVHSYKSFKGILKKHLNDSEFNYYFNQVLNFFFKTDPILKTASSNLNSPLFTKSDEKVLVQFFNSYSNTI